MIFVAHPNQRLFIRLPLLAGLPLFFDSDDSSDDPGRDGSNMNNVDSFRLERVLVWLNPQKYSSEGGYQIMQASYAIGSGGFFGKGLGNSVQKLGPVPEAQNDMIFSIVCEELGVFGGLIIIGLFGYLLYRLFLYCAECPDFYGSLMVSGIMIHIALQVILNICVVLNWIPTTGYYPSVCQLRRYVNRCSLWRKWELPLVCQGGLNLTNKRVDKYKKRRYTLRIKII